MEENKTNKVTYSFAEISQCSRISNTSKNHHAHQQIATVCRQRRHCINPSDPRKRISARENLRNQYISNHKKKSIITFILYKQGKRNSGHTRCRRSSDRSIFIPTSSEFLPPEFSASSTSSLLAFLGLSLPPSFRKSDRPNSKSCSGKRDSLNLTCSSEMGKTDSEPKGVALAPECCGLSLQNRRTSQHSSKCMHRHVSHAVITKH